MKFPRVRCIICGRETAGTRDGYPWTHVKPGQIKEPGYRNRCIGERLPGMDLVVRLRGLRKAPEHGAECYGDRVANVRVDGAERDE